MAHGQHAKGMLRMVAVQPARSGIEHREAPRVDLTWMAHGQHAKGMLRMVVTPMVQSARSGIEHREVTPMVRPARSGIEHREAPRVDLTWMAHGQHAKGMLRINGD